MLRSLDLCSLRTLREVVMSEVTSMCLVSKDKLASSHCDMTVCIWDLHSGKCVNKLYHSHSVTRVRLVSEHILASSCGDRTVNLWDLRTCECVCTLHTNHAVGDVCGMPNDILVCGLYNGSVLVFDACTGNEMHEIREFSRRVRLQSAVSNSELLTSDGFVFKVLDVVQGTCVKTINERGVAAVPRLDVVRVSPACSSLRSLVIGDHSGDINVWDVRAQKTSFVACGLNNCTVGICVITRDVYAIFSKSNIVLWNARTHTHVCSLFMGIRITDVVVVSAGVLAVSAVVLSLTKLEVENVIYLVDVTDMKVDLGSRFMTHVLTPDAGLRRLTSDQAAFEIIVRTAEHNRARKRSNGWFEFPRRAVCVMRFFV